MVVVGIDGDRRRYRCSGRCRDRRARRHDAQPVVAGLDGCAELLQLVRHRRDAIGFLHAPASDVAQGRRAIGEQREHRDGHCGVGHVVEVGIDRAQTKAGCDAGRTHFGGRVALRNLRAHRDQHVDETRVSLQAVASDAFNAYRSAAEQACSEQIRGRRCIAFDREIAGTRVARALRDHEAIRLRLVHDGAEALHQSDRQIDIGTRDEIAFDLDDKGRVTRKQRCGLQKASEELARRIAAHANDPFESATILRQRGLRHFRRRDAQRRAARGRFVFNARPDPDQRIDEIADRPLVHARDARQSIVPLRECEHSGLRANRQP